MEGLEGWPSFAKASADGESEGIMEHVATDLFRRAEIGWKVGYME